MFIQLFDDFTRTPIIINTDAIVYIEVRTKKSQEDPTRSEFKRAVVNFNNSSIGPLWLDEADYNILKNVITKK